MARMLNSTYEDLMGRVMADCPDLDVDTAIDVCIEMLTAQTSPATALTTIRRRRFLERRVMVSGDLSEHGIADDYVIPYDELHAKYRGCRREWRRRYYKQVRARALEQNRQWRAENKERIAEYKRAYDAEHRGEIREYNRRYYEANAEKLREAARHERARKKAAARGGDIQA